ncbi:MAG: hypothetical protein ACK4RF_07350 [Cyclobacteriaceae bacterium]
MTPFEYVIVLISIIIGLGITVILNGIARLIRNWRSVKVFWPYLIWIVLVFVMHIHEWWIMYDWRTIQSWSLLTFLFILLYPVLLFILANLLFPKKGGKKETDLKRYYFIMYPKFFLSALLLIATAIFTDVLIAGLPVRDQVVKILLFGILLVATLTRPRNEWVHGALAAFLLAVMIISLFILSEDLVIQ